MPRPNGSSQDGLSDRMKDAIDVVSASGEPEAHFRDDKKAAWGESDDDHYQTPQADVKASTREEVNEFWDIRSPEDITIRKR